MRRSFAVGLFALACGGADETNSETSPMKMKEDGGTTDLPMGTSSGGIPEVAGDRCESPLVVRPGVRTGTLANAQSDAENVCGPGGPDVFVQVEVDRRADLIVDARGEGFVPFVGVVESCSFGAAPLGCVQGVPMTVLDLPAGAAPIVVVGIGDGDPALADESGGREFVLDLRLRAVLAAGEACMPKDRGRCEVGSACLPDRDAVAHCTVLAADTCATAEPHVLALGESTSITVDPGQPQTDAHEHGCTGARRRDRVLRVDLPEVLPPATSLRIGTDAADVGLAVRSASCLADDELGCAAPEPDGLVLVVPDLLASLGNERAVYVFVELPLDPVGDDEIDPGELPPFEVALALVAP
ncbi:MAG TPA: hypothetical protein VFG69_04255 [Nannocystaceae bacterium]|nr:hypothetical protein [Nannocystaceae bacterium]